MMFCIVDEDRVHKTDEHILFVAVRIKYPGISDTGDGLIHPFERNEDKNERKID